ncbi:MAG: methylmalonyl Co-A mutase-associated GTPase MeaB [Chitinophagaceae bacterium]
MESSILSSLMQGDIRALARCISLVENEVRGYTQILEALPPSSPTLTVGITGPPGAGKSTLVDGITRQLLEQHHKVAILAVDPSSPFHRGALLGDRIRMSRHFTDPRVFIRSLSTRGSLGGLHPKILEMADLIRAAGFDYLLMETVGVGQSEVEIAGLADSTVVVLVPESGDEVQSMKAGLLEIADLLVVNKSDRPGAQEWVQILRHFTHQHSTKDWEIPVLKTIATTGEGIQELLEKIRLHQQLVNQNPEKKSWLLAEKAYQLIQAARMKDTSKIELQQRILAELKSGDFNLYRWIRKWI